MAKITPINKKSLKVAKTFEYVVEFLRDLLESRISRDITTNTIMVTKKLSWDEEELDHENGEYYEDDANIYVRPFKDADLLVIKKLLSGRKKLEFSINEIKGAVEYLANLQTVNPIERYLNSLEWDEIPRLENWLLDYCEAYGPSISVIKKVSVRFMVGMVRRGITPGEKMDYMLILQGKQGIGKSTLCRLLAGKDSFFSEEIPRFSDPRTIIETYGGKMLVEVGEMANFATTSQIELLKHFITKRVDQARPAYSQFPILMPRTFTLIGTTNAKTFIVDPSGWRRYWPICIRSINLGGIRLIRDQLLAEAVFYARHDIHPTFLDEEEENEYDNFRTSRIKVGSETLIDTIREQFENFKELSGVINTHRGEKFGLTTNVIKNILGEKLDESKISSQEIGKALTSLGFTKHRTATDKFWILPVELPEDDEEFEASTIE